MGEQRILHHRQSLLASNEALYDGIPRWMNNSVRNWVSHRFYKKSGNTTYYHNKLMHEVELHSRLTFGRYTDGFHLFSGAINVFNGDENFALDMVQAIVELCRVTKDYEYDEMTVMRTALEELDRILIAGGSKWHIVIDGEKARVEARVNQTTTSAYQQLINSQEDYAPLLKTSWEYCYGRQPNPSEAYTYAIRAVEAAGWRIISPNNNKATLGTLIKDLGVQSQAGKITTVFKDNKSGDTITMAVVLMQRLWESQTDRHATGNYVKPSPAEAEAAVHIALTLCHLFTSGAITRKT